MSASRIDETTLEVHGHAVVVRRLRIERAREARSLPLVLVHGAGGNHLAFDFLLAALASYEIDVLVPAFPGHAASRGDALSTVAALSAWLDATCEVLGLERVIVAGHSLGGAVAIDLACSDAPAAKSRLAGLGLIATGARLRVAPIILDAVRLAIATRAPLDLSRFEYGPDVAHEIVAREEIARRLTAPEAALADWLAADAFDRMQDLARIDVPTSVVAGADDALTPLKYARYLADRIRGADLVVVPGAGHMLQVERPRETAAALAGLVARARP